MNFEQCFSKISPVKISEVPQGFLLLCETIFETGVRPVELREVRVKDFNFSNEEISLSQCHISNVPHVSDRRRRPLGRCISISESLAERLDEHISTLRVPAGVTMENLKIFPQHPPKPFLDAARGVANKFRHMYALKNVLSANRHKLESLSGGDEEFQNFLMKALFDEPKRWFKAKRQ